MPYCPVFDNNCFGANSTLFIPAFKGPRKPTSSISEATSRGLSSKEPDKWEVHEQLRARKDELRKLADDDDVSKHDKYHAANLISRLSPAMLDCDIITVAVHAQPLSFSINPHPKPPSKPAKHNQDKGREQWEGAGVEANETGKNETEKRERVAGEVEAAVGEHSNKVDTHELVHVTMLAIELPPNDAGLGEYNPPPPPPDPPPRNCPQRLLRNMEPVSTHPLAPTIPSHAAISAPTPTLSSREAPSLNANKSCDRKAMQTCAE
jgi:hypothetical protein